MRDQPRPPSYVVIGTSLGGGAALSQVFKALPVDFPGAILIVVHVPATLKKSWLPGRLEDLGNVPVKEAKDGEHIDQGKAYLAPAGKHLIVEADRIRLVMGPLEQHARPSIDALFRSAASAFGSHVIGVVLTGRLRDGTLGLRAIRDAGGITIVQNPEGAEAGEMPRNAMAGLGVDYCLDIAEIGPVLDLLVRRAGPHKEGVLETGLATSVRLMKDRVRLLARLYDQSRDNPKTRHFLEAEIAALAADIADIERMIPSTNAR